VVSGILRALSLCAPIAAMGMPSALAQQLAPTALMTDIPAQPLGEALAVFANQTGLQLVYVSGVVDGRRSRAPATAWGRLRVSRICALRVNVPAGTEGGSPLACFVDRLGSLHGRS
jgi:hypothetical protein